MTFKDDEIFLVELLHDTERQLNIYNDLVPFEYNQDVYSPTLLNLLLATCCQIEALCGLFVSELKLPGPAGNGMKDVISQIDKSGVLSAFDIQGRTVYGTFKPFASNYEWWTKYNKIKHFLVVEGRSVKYRHVVDAMAALAALHQIATEMIRNPGANPIDIVEIKHWGIGDNNTRFRTKCFQIISQFNPRGSGSS